jgi:hypothetical protein
MLEKRLLNGDFRPRNCLWKPKNAIFPVKFPVSREIRWRRVRSALRRQPDLKLLSLLCKQLPSRQVFWTRLEMELLMLDPESN